MGGATEMTALDVLKRIIANQKKQIIALDKDLSNLREFINEQCTNETDPVRSLVNIQNKVSKIEKRFRKEN